MTVKKKPMPKALAEIALGRDYITTREFAKTVNRREETIRKNYHLYGHTYGIRPLKIGGGPLSWPVDRIAALLNGEMTDAERRLWETKNPRSCVLGLSD